jgi:hypothetical protein
MVLKPGKNNSTTNKLVVVESLYGMNYSPKTLEYYRSVIYNGLFPKIQKKITER